MSLQRCQAETSSTDFVGWMEYLKYDTNTPSRDHWYMAQIAAEIRRGNVKNPERVKIADLILPFVTGGKAKPVDPATQKDRITRSKSKWLALVGMKPRKPVNGNGNVSGRA